MKRIVLASEKGFTLLEMVCVIALVAILAAVLLPLVPRTTSRALGCRPMRSRLLHCLKPIAMLQSGVVPTSQLWWMLRRARSGRERPGKLFRIPDDVRFEALLPQTCRQRAGIIDDQFLLGRYELRRYRLR